MTCSAWPGTRARDALAIMGLEYDLDRPTGALSVGQRQIVEIARLRVDKTIVGCCRLYAKLSTAS